MDIRFKLAELKKMDWPADEFVVVGSGPLAIRGIREAKDLDIIVTEKLWDKLTEDHVPTVNEWGVERATVAEDVEILNPAQSLFGNSDVATMKEIFDTADVFDGVKFINLDYLKKIKAKLGRKSDLRDIALIDGYLRRPES